MCESYAMNRKSPTLLCSCVFGDKDEWDDALFHILLTRAEYFRSLFTITPLTIIKHIIAQCSVAQASIHSTLISSHDHMSLGSEKSLRTLAARSVEQKSDLRGPGEDRKWWMSLMGVMGEGTMWISSSSGCHGNLCCCWLGSLAWRWWSVEGSPWWWRLPAPMMPWPPWRTSRSALVLSTCRSLRWRSR